MVFQSKRCSTLQDIVVHIKKKLFFNTILRASHLISEVNIMLTQNSKRKASRDGQRLRHRGQGGDRYTGLGKALCTIIHTKGKHHLQLNWVLWKGGC
jgi:hypothetical protein